jgi:uncharacterized membrane protein
MAALLCVAFQHVDTADKALIELQILQANGSAELADACVVRRNVAGDIDLKQSVDLVGGGAVGGGLLGAVCGSLLGLLFLNPLTGMLVGAGIGAVTGAISGALSDYGINDRFIEELGRTLTPGSSALFVLTHRLDVEAMLARLERYRPIVLRASPGDHRHRRLLAQRS